MITTLPYAYEAFREVFRIDGDLKWREIMRSIAEHAFTKAFFSQTATVYRNELYDYAECINLAVLLQGRFSALDSILSRLANFSAWQKPDGSFRSRQLLIGWDNTPMHRWAQSQMFRSLCFLLYRDAQSATAKTSN